ncbi:hypothetical protein [Polyangium spumosum]|uniref:Cytochrome c domain-containing protein n=1 Tax=Polyangium spumosum TaxID=889282 RepID=A0A6N7PK45_9BACT|nr:hypothetical protein [Polyangium spumosum]MRG92413.1 hypothetical protein [Polyangium spumosum]
MRTTASTFLLAGLTTLVALAACKSGEESTSSSAPPPPPTASAAPSAFPAPAPVIVREGGALVRSPSEPALYLADEDQQVVRRIALPADARNPPVAVHMPGPPAAVLATGDRVLVTVRGIRKSDDLASPYEGPGLLLVMRPDPAAGLVELGRVELPADAWGLAITPDASTALVTSPWAHAVSAVDLGTLKKRWTLDVPREPRAVVALPDGKTAYVTHLVRAALTRIDALDGEARAKDVPFPGAPLRTPADPLRREAATLAYSAVLSPDGARLFVPRHALGAMGESAWNGQNTVDILSVVEERPLAERAPRWFVMQAKSFQKTISEFGFEHDDPHLTGPAPSQIGEVFVQPRAVVYRKKTRTLLVASEGTDHLVELDALSLDPSLGALRKYDLGATRSDDEKDKPGDTRCGAPTGIALSEDEATAFVFCRSSHDLAIVRLDAYDKRAPYEPAPPAIFSLGPDFLPEQAALGRRLYYNARDWLVSNAFACAGCHPEGRDDGHVWHEDIRESFDEKGKYEPGAIHAFEDKQAFEGFMKGVPRQTPMLAGRVAAHGPYGWKGESPNLKHRVIIGFGIHRWLGGGPLSHSADKTIPRAEAILAFARRGLVPPPRHNREKTAEEERGEVLFNDPNVGCATCHLPRTEYTNRALVGLGPWAFDKARFDAEPEGDWKFKTPSLLFLAGSAPYYHDGSAATLEELVERNGKRMGHTDHLSKEDRAALVAFLKTL